VIPVPRLEDVAQRAQVSISTASRALSRPELVAAETVGRVLKAARELGYQPNQVARSLRTRVNQTIGLLVSDILNPFHATLAKGLQDAAFDHGYHLLLCNTDEDPTKEAAYLRLFQSNQLRGFVIVPTERSRRLLQEFSDIPVVEADRTSGLPNLHAVLADNLSGTRQAVEHLIQLGHRKIAIIAGKPDVTTGVERLEGYLQTMRAFGLEVNPRWIVHGNHREEGGYRAARELLNLPPNDHPTAWFVINNEMTAGAVRAIREAGLHIPKDLSIVGFDDSRWAQLMDPPLTVVDQPAYDLGYTSGEILFKLFERASPPPKVVRLHTQLVVRSSTAPPST
jgi:DNA-binding LacI/PurR family transcriptional regulator